MRDQCPKLEQQRCALMTTVIILDDHPFSIENLLVPRDVSLRYHLVFSCVFILFV